MCIARAFRVLPLVVFGAACGRSTALPADAGAPRLEFAEAQHDFGTVNQGDLLKHVFTVRNKGSAPLVIDRVAASCGCTAAVLKDKVIPPGGSGQIEASFDTHNRSGKSHTSITVFCNDRSKPSFVADLNANVEVPLAVAPVYVRLATEYRVPTVEKIWFSGKLLAEARPAVALIESDGRPENRVEDDAAIRRALGVTPVEEQEGGKPKRGMALRLAADRITSGHGRLLVSTGLPKPEQLEVRLTWSVAGNLEVDPAMVYLDGNQPAARERIVRVSSKRPGLRLKRVRVVKGLWQATLDRQPDAAGKFHIKVSWPAVEPEQISDGAIEISSNDPIEPRKLVRVLVPRAQKTIP